MSVTLILTLFFIMDSIGNIPAYLTMVDGLPRRRQNYIVIREMTLALVTMVIFNFIGEFVLSELNISIPAATITTGLLLFLIAIKVLFFPASSIRANITPGEPFFIPLAIPLVAGPGLLASIMLYAITEDSIWTMLTAIVIAWGASVIVLLQGHRLKKLLGQNILGAAERITAMVLVLLGIQRILEGIGLFSKQIAS